MRLFSGRQGFVLIKPGYCPGYLAILDFRRTKKRPPSVGGFRQPKFIKQQINFTPNASPCKALTPALSPAPRRTIHEAVAALLTGPNPAGKGCLDGQGKNAAP
jgi:hypothetical protein